MHTLSDSLTIGKCPHCGGHGYVPTASGGIVDCPDPECPSNLDVGSQPFWFPDDSDWEAELAAHRDTEGKVA